MVKRILSWAFIFLLLFAPFGYARGGGGHGEMRNYLKRVDTSITPTADNTYDIGTAARRIRTFRAVTLYGDGANITAIAAANIAADSIDGTQLADVITVDGTGFDIGDGAGTNETRFSTAGLITYGGTAKPNRTIILTAAGGTLPATGGPALATIDGTNVDYKVLDFDAAADETVYWTIILPDSYDAGTITPTVRWQAGATSGDCIWATQMAVVRNAVAMDATLSTAGTVTDTALGTANQLNDAAIAAHTPAGTPAAGDLLHIVLYRDANAGGDNMAGDARFIHLKLEYVANAESD